MQQPLRLLTIITTALAAATSGCVGSTSATASGSDGVREFPLGTLETSSVSLKGQSVTVWLADTAAKQTEGLMHVTEEELGDKGMLFVFSDEQVRGFWMKNTITSLDIAFARMDGTIVATHTMSPLTLRNFSSIEPAMLALEIRTGRLAELGVAAGDRIELPASVFTGGG
jgi:hypothetical protein